jgi:hypothetical protein
MERSKGVFRTREGCRLQRFQQAHWEGDHGRVPIMSGETFTFARSRVEQLEKMVSHQIILFPERDETFRMCATQGSCASKAD